MASSAFQVAFQGHRGAYGDDVALSLARSDDRCTPCAKLDEVFDAVMEGRVELGVAPIENSLAGPVLRAYDLLITHPTVIVGEVTKHIDHVLIGTTGASVQALRQVYSHPVALAQCERFFERNPHIQPVAWGDTAGAAEHITRSGRAEWAAIAGRRAARLYQGDILAEHIQDHEENYTRFVLIVRPDAALRPEPPVTTPLYKTTVLFKVTHEPGTLVRALRAFATRGVDLSSIESRPVHGSPFEYVFWIDLVGRADTPAFAAAIDEARTNALELRVLGSYPRWNERDAQAQAAGASGMAAPS